MGYTPTEWAAGDVVTAAKLNKLEQGVVESGGLPAYTSDDVGKALVLTADPDHVDVRVIVPEQTIDRDTTSELLNVDQSVGSTVNGDAFVVTFDGVAYEIEASVSPNNINLTDTYVGSPTFFISLTDNYAGRTDWGAYLWAPGTGTHTVSITKLAARSKPAWGVGVAAPTAEDVGKILTVSEDPAHPVPGRHYCVSEQSVTRQSGASSGAVSVYDFSGSISGSCVLTINGVESDVERAYEEDAVRYWEAQNGFTLEYDTSNDRCNLIWPAEYTDNTVTLSFAELTSVPGLKTAWNILSLETEALSYALEQSVRSVITTAVDGFSIAGSDAVYADMITVSADDAGKLAQICERYYNGQPAVISLLGYSLTTFAAQIYSANYGRTVDLCIPYYETTLPDYAFDLRVTVDFRIPTRSGVTPSARVVVECVKKEARD